MRKYDITVYSGAWVIRVEHKYIKNSNIIVHSKGSNLSQYNNLYFDRALDGENFFINNEHRISEDGYYYNEEEWREIQLNRILRYE